MSMTDCEKCWETPCSCGWEYRGLTAERRLELAAVIIGIQKDSMAFLELRAATPQFHPKAVDPRWQP